MTTDKTQELDEILDTLNQFAPDQLAHEMEAQAKQSILDWHNKQIEETMAKFHLKRGVEYDVKASDSVIVITPSIKPKDSYQ